MYPPPPLWHPPGAITPGKVIQHHRKVQGRSGGTGTVPSVNRCFYNLLKTQGFYKAEKSLYFLKKSDHSILRWNLFFLYSIMDNVVIVGQKSLKKPGGCR